MSDKDFTVRSKERIKDLEERIERIVTHTIRYEKLKKIVPDLTAHYSHTYGEQEYNRVEFRSKWATDNWDEISCGGGQCSAYYARAIIVRNGVRIYGDRIHIGTDYNNEYHFNEGWGIEPDNDWKVSIIKKFGEKAVPIVQEYLDKNKVVYDDDDEEDEVN